MLPGCVKYLIMIGQNPAAVNNFDDESYARDNLDTHLILNQSTESSPAYFPFAYWHCGKNVTQSVLLTLPGL